MFMVSGSLLVLMLVVGVMAQWRTLPAPNAAVEPLSPQGGTPAKEYIYAGRKLVATEETSSSRINVALSTNGATATASSVYGNDYAPSYAIDGNRKAQNWWADNTSTGYPDWLEVQFAGSKTIDEIDVIGLQANYANPSDPTPEMTSPYASTDFVVEYWNGSTWTGVPGANITNNNKVWRKFTFQEITTTKIRVYVTNVSGDNHSHIMELEAYQQ